MFLRVVFACVLLLCAAGSLGCGAVRVGSFPKPGTDCPTESDVVLVSLLLGRESIGQAERERLALLAVATRVADAAAYCAASANQ